ncbi:acid-sensing ion channel 5-like isoform X2 [Clytia hemisphaerica]|uniref:acid-sensing ion channel 5-like isoform X2 n=1 Tax=Clytia hemisphaerica TaxID=252671 RepID=UPI0034D67377
MEDKSAFLIDNSHKMEGQKAKEKLKTKWKDLYSSCSFDGFHYIFDERGFLRIFWLLMVLGATALSIVLFYGVIEEYYNFKSHTSIEEVLSNDKVEFPTVTICNINAVSKRKIEKAGYNSSVEEIVSFYQDLREGHFNANKSNKVLEELKANGLTKMGDLLKHFEYTFGEIMEDSVLKDIAPRPCMFKDRECNKDEFTEVISAHYGLCYQFNSIYLEMNRLYANEAGEGAGLRLYLNIDEEDLLVSNVPFTGLQVFVHPFGEPFESAIARRVPISPGSMNYIHIDYRQWELLESPYASACASKNYNLVKKIVPYSQSMCSVDCTMSKMMDKCGCVSEEFANHLEDKNKTCKYNQIQCVEQMLGNLQQMLHTCRVQCPRQCLVTKYGISTGQTAMGNSKVYKMLKQKHNKTIDEGYAFINKNVFGIDVTFSDIVYLKETMSPAQNWISVLSTIGGSLGLAMGCSVVTFIEFIVFGIQALYWYCKYKLSDDCTSPQKANAIQT